MNQQQVGGIVRAIMLGASGILVSLGFQQAAGPGWEALTGMAVAASGVAWSWWVHSTARQIDNVANKDEVVAVVLADQAKAEANPSPKIVAIDGGVDWTSNRTAVK